MNYQTLTYVGPIAVMIYLMADFRLTWIGQHFRDLFFHYNTRDIANVLGYVLPAILSHLISIWGHYYKADARFQDSITKVSTASMAERKRISIWERHDPWIGFTYRYWVMVAICVVINLVWFVQPIAMYLPRNLKSMGYYAAITAYLAFGCGYAAMGACGLLMLFVLRRSMLQALGFTYADLLPLHRWMGVAMIGWTTVHGLCYILYYIHVGAFWRNFNFDGTTRGPMNMIALLVYAALMGLGFTAIPRVRRSCYLLFITTHRVFTVIVFIGTLLHFPYYILWYYVLPCMCLYLADRFVPRFIQSVSIARHAECTFNKDADILTLRLVSRDPLVPLKPYYPGDFVTVEIPELSTIPHPFTIASHWTEDPYSITLYIRSFQETKTSWTGALATLCQEKIKDPEGVLLIETNVDGVYGDREHDYLQTKTMVIFVAGAAITTFMSLLTAIAAQVEASSQTMNNPAVIQVHLICTFRYESELYAYGDFMHRITHDPRFLSWLHTHIYVSRPDKYTPPTPCPSGQCTSEFVCGRIESDQDTDSSNSSDDDDDDSEDDGSNVIKSAKHVIAPVDVKSGITSKSRYGAMDATECGGCDNDKRCCRDSTSSSSSASSLTLATSALPYPRASPPGSSPASTPTAVSVATTPALTRTPTPTGDRDPSGIYLHRAIPTFPAAGSTKYATLHAKKDLLATTMILVLPMIMFLWSRAIPWEGTYKGETHWCRTTTEGDQHMTNRCMWSYVLLPGLVHIAAAMVLGFLALWAARSTSLFGRTTARHGSKGGAVIYSKGGGKKATSAAAAYKNLLEGLSASEVEAATATTPLIRGRPGPRGGSSSSSSAQQVPKGSIEFLRGRIQVNNHIQELKSKGIGRDETGEDRDRGVLVFGGGPEAFVDMIHKSCVKAKWNVDYHAETWAP